jgi:hypothetical protein
VVVYKIHNPILLIEITVIFISNHPGPALRGHPSLKRMGKFNYFLLLTEEEYP